MNQFEKRQLFLACFLACLPLRDKVRASFEREWMLERDEIEALEVKQVPSVVLNMIVANGIRKQLGEARGIREFFFSGNLWLLNVPSRFSETGLILPVKDASRSNIKCLQVYRHAKDTRPFIVGQF